MNTASSVASNVRSTRCSWSSVATRSETSRTAATANTSSSRCSGLRLISTGNSEPSDRRAHSSNPAPIARTVGSARKRVRWARCTARSASGSRSSTTRPNSSASSNPNSSPAWSFTNTISPVPATINVASGVASSNDHAKSSPYDLSSGDRTPMTTVSPSAFSPEVAADRGPGTFTTCDERQHHATCTASREWRMGRLNWPARGRGRAAGEMDAEADDRTVEAATMLDHCARPVLANGSVPRR